MQEKAFKRVLILKFSQGSIPPDPLGCVAPSSMYWNNIVQSPHKKFAAAVSVVYWELCLRQFTDVMDIVPVIPLVSGLHFSVRIGMHVNVTVMLCNSF